MYFVSIPVRQRGRRGTYNFLRLPLPRHPWNFCRMKLIKLTFAYIREDINEKNGGGLNGHDLHKKFFFKLHVLNRKYGVIKIAN